MAEEFNIALAGLWYIVLLISFVFHEAAHAWAALKLGDSTAYHGGQVTLDPIPHIKREPFGMILVPIVSYMLAGWMMGWASAPYDPFWAAQNRRKAAWMALAGPAANLGLVIVAALAIRIGMLMGAFFPPDETAFTRITEAAGPGIANSLAIVVSIVFSLNLILMVFNLIPLPPLDGSDVLMLFLNEESADRYRQMMSQPGVRIFGFVIAWNIFGYLLSPVQTVALNLLYPGSGYH
jgi:Zn-dependent protease